MREIKALLRAPLEYRYGTLFMSLLLLLSAPALLPERLDLLGTSIVFTLVVSAGVGAIAQTQRTFLTALLIAAPALLLFWIGPSLGTRVPEVLGDILLAAFLAYAAAAILNRVLQADHVDAETIYGAVCVYFLFAAFWAVIFALVETLAPGSFNLPESVNLVGGSRFDSGPMFYYSFVTITTLGYGDITPATELTRLLALLEAVLGQLYLVILIARLVGLYTTRGASGTE
ncbi:MAG: two pore domain potassium channel family protein [Gemmatimonadota bacterium]|nr:MAG: two pore domain potassium channel family protein [Gemmatimonadota bacterium]